VAHVHKYSYHCVTEGIQVVEDVYRESEPTECMNDPAHEIENIGIESTVSDNDVNLANVATINDVDHPPLRVVISPSDTGLYLCDRDILLKTCYIETATAVEDLKVKHTPGVPPLNATDNKRVDWSELTLVGCYKGDEDTGFTLCDDQDDADANATLSVFQFLANNQNDGTSVLVAFRGGGIWVDPGITDSWDHQIYAILAPDIAPAYGGCIRFFDGYLKPYKGETMMVENSLAMSCDPSATPAAAILRIWVYHPAGEKAEHILRLVIFRQPAHF